MDGECSSDDWIGSDVGPPKGDIQSTIDWFLLNKNFLLEKESVHLLFFSRIFLTSTLNFSFWTADETETYVKVYKNKTYHGYEALCVAINQAIDVNSRLFPLNCLFSFLLNEKDGIDILNAQYYSRITMEELEDLFQSTGKRSRLPMLNERLSVLHDTGSILLKVNSINFSST